MKKKTAMVYPYTKEYSYYAEYGDLIKDYELISIVAGKGSGYGGMSYHIGDKCLEISELFEIEVNKCEVVIFLFYDRPFENPQSEIEGNNHRYNNNLLLIEKCKYAASMGREVFCITKQEWIIKSLKMYIPSNLLIFLERKNILDDNIVHLQNIRKPVVFITSLFEGLGKADLLFEIYSSLKKLNINACIVSSRIDMHLFGFDVLDCFNERYETSKRHILSINSYFKDLEMNDEFDLFIVEIPGGCVPFSREAPIDFGTTFYTYSRANYPDYVILLLPYYVSCCDDVKSWKDAVSNSFGVDIDECVIAQKSIIYQETSTSSTMTTLSLDREFIMNQCSKQNADYLDDISIDADSIVEKMIGTLYKYGEVDIL